MKRIITALFLLIHFVLSAQSWEIFNSDTNNRYISSVIEGDDMIYTLSFNYGESFLNPVELKAYLALNGQETFVKKYVNDSLSVQLFTLFYNESKDEIIGIGGALDLRETTSIEDAEAYFVTVVFDKELEVVKENLTFLADNKATVAFLNASEKNNSGYVITLNLNTFPTPGFYQNIFIELDAQGEIVGMNKTEPQESIYGDTQWFITENLKRDGYLSMGVGYYNLDSDLNFESIEIDAFLLGGIPINRGLIKTLTDSTYLFYSDYALVQGKIQAVILDEELNVTKNIILESINNVPFGYPMDFLTPQCIYVATSHRSTLGGPPNESYFFEIFQLNENLDVNWIKVFGTNNDRKSFSVRDVTCTKDLGVLVAGEVKYLNKNNTWSSANEFIIKFDENGITPTNETPSELSSIITIYPNPTTDYMTIRNDQSRDLEFQIYDAAGRLISTQQMSAADANITIETHSLTAGSYILHTISDDRQIDSYQFVKQ